MDGFVQTKAIVPTHDLYGINPQIFYDMPYQDVLALKIKKSTEIIKKCHNQHYLKRDSQKLNKALSTIKFNEGLLNEMGISLDNK